MKQFLLRLFAAIGVLLTISLSLGAFSMWSWINSESEGPEAPKSMYLTLDFTNPISEPIHDFAPSLARILYDEGKETPLIYIVRALENAKNDPKVKGVVAMFGGESVSLVHAQEIAAALDSFRTSGKPSYVFAPSYGDFASGGSIYYLASRFENIWLQPIGAVGLGSLVIEAPFGKTALSKLGVETDFMRREEYKSVMENVSRDSFSPTVRANMESMLKSLSDQIAQGLAAGRKFAADQAQSIVANGPYTSGEALKSGLVTKLGYEDEIEKELKDKAGDKDVAFLDPASYLFYFNRDRKDESKGDIAIIYAEGVITDHPAKGPSALAEDEMIDTQSIVDAFKDATEDKDIKAIIFRVNSPGGSPVASETIRRALIKAKESKKPVFVSMGRVAASGGYWIAMDADRIIANPATITGSIGVVSGKFVLGGLFDKLGVKWDSIKTSENANLWSSRTPFDAKGRERINAMLDETYKAFTDNVAAARKIAPEKMPDIAKGRVFTGEQALKVGLVDELGGLDTTIASMKKQLKLEPTDRLMLRQFPEPETPATLVLKLLQDIGSGGAMIRGSLGELKELRAAFAPLFESLSAASQPVSARLPSSFMHTGS